MKTSIPLWILSYIKTSSKNYDGVGYQLQSAIHDACIQAYGDDIQHVFYDGVCVGVVGGASGGKHLPKRSTAENCKRYGIDYVSHVFCSVCNKQQRVALCHKIPRVCFGALHHDNLYLDCAICNSHVSDTLDDTVKQALAQFTITIEL